MSAISTNESPELLYLPIQRNDLGTKTNVFGAENIIKKTYVEFKKLCMKWFQMPNFTINCTF